MKHFIDRKVLFIIGLLLIFGGMANLILHFVERSNTEFSFFVSFFSFVLGMICVVIGGFISAKNHPYNTNKDTYPNNKTDVLSDSSFSLLEGNLFHETSNN